MALEGLIPGFQWEFWPFLAFPGNLKAQIPPFLNLRIDPKELKEFWNQEVPKKG